MVIDGYVIEFIDENGIYDGDNPPEWFLERLAKALGCKYTPKDKKEVKPAQK